MKTKTYLKILTFFAASRTICAVLNPGNAKHEPKSAENSAKIIIIPSLEVRSKLEVISSNPISNIDDGIDKEARQITKFIDPNIIMTDRSPAFAFPADEISRCLLFKYHIT